MLLLVLACECLTSSSSSESEVLGWIMIAVVTLAIHINLVTMMASAWYQFVLLYTRFANFRSKFNSKTAQVMPRKVSIDNRNALSSPDNLEE